jgi:phosphoribosylanthranilate isomerase
MSTKVKICGITNLDDARAAVDAGADMRGLMFYEGSPRHLTLKAAAGITNQLPPFVVKVGVFVNPAEELVTAAIGACELNILQFHGEESPEFCLQFGLMTVKAFRIRDANSLQALPAYPTDAWLLDACVPDQHGGTGARFNSSRVD